jgi:hypothetical protein
MAATLFWAAQTLANTVLRPSGLDSNACHPPAIARAMARGADGLFDVGQSQFEDLARLARDLVDWIATQGLRSVALIESPLGNSVPVQLIGELLKDRKISFHTVLWNAPRNDKPARGRTAREAAKQCAAATAENDLVIFLDEVLSGTRFVKLYDALSKEIEGRRFLPIAMTFHDIARPAIADSPSRKRLESRLAQHQASTAFRPLIVPFPRHRLFKIDSGNWVHWPAPAIWGDSDLIAGKRKVNLIFTLIDHCVFRRAIHAETHSGQSPVRSSPFVTAIPPGAVYGVRSAFAATRAERCLMVPAR